MSVHESGPVGDQVVAPDPRFVIDPFEPAYSIAARTGVLAERVAQARAELACCRACPHDCEVDRLSGEVGVCKIGRDVLVSSAYAHFGEEDCLSGTRGSGTIFLSGCNLRCVFCQNWEVSQRPVGTAHTAEQLAALMMRLQELGCHNVNLVTPEHVIPQVVEAIAHAAPLGLSIPIVYNTSGYDSVDALRLLDGLVDVYMPDFKFWEPATASALCRAPDYPERARAAIAEMHRQVGDLHFGTDGLALRGLLVRHLVMPGQSGEAAAILRWLASDVSDDTYVNVMAKYRPAGRVGTRDMRGQHRFQEIDRPMHPAELWAAYDAGRTAGLWRFDGNR